MKRMAKLDASADVDTKTSRKVAEGLRKANGLIQNGSVDGRR